VYSASAETLASSEEKTWRIGVLKRRAKTRLHTAIVVRVKALCPTCLPHFGDSTTLVCCMHARSEGRPAPFAGGAPNHNVIGATCPLTTGIQNVNDVVLPRVTHAYHCLPPRWFGFTRMRGAALNATCTVVSATVCCGWWARRLRREQGRLWCVPAVRWLLPCLYRTTAELPVSAIGRYCWNVDGAASFHATLRLPRTAGVLDVLNPKAYHYLLFGGAWPAVDTTGWFFISFCASAHTV